MLKKLKKPTRPVPLPPLERQLISRRHSVLQVSLYDTDNRKSVAQIIQELPLESPSLENLSLELYLDRGDYEDYEGSSTAAILYVIWTSLETDAEFAKSAKNYQKNLKKYQKEQKTYETKLVEYETWLASNKDALELEIQEIKIKEAEKLEKDLEQHIANQEKVLAKEKQRLSELKKGIKK